jgi:hypothetical protein
MWDVNKAAETVVRSQPNYSVLDLFTVILIVFGGYCMTLSVVNLYSFRWYDDLEGSGRSLIEVISRKFPGETEETHENLQSG